MAKDDVGDGALMPVADLKLLLHVARRQAVNCAVAIAKDKQGVILLHRRTKPRKLVAELQRQAKASGLELDPTSVRFGRAAVDGGSDSAMVTFTVNKPAPGPMRRALLEQVRPASFQRCEIVVDEGLEAETDDDAVGSTADGIPNATPAGEAALLAPAGPGQTAASATPSGLPAQQSGSPAALASPPLNPAATNRGRGSDAGGRPFDELLGLTQRIVPLAAADPSCQQPLVTLAAGARACLRNGDSRGASAGIAALRDALFKAEGRREDQPGSDQTAAPGQSARDSLLTPAAAPGFGTGEPLAGPNSPAAGGGSTQQTPLVAAGPNPSGSSNPNGRRPDEDTAA